VNRKLPLDHRLSLPGTAIFVVVAAPSLSAPVSCAVVPLATSPHTTEEEATMTISPDLEAQVLRYYHAERWRIGTIAHQLGLHHGTVERVLAQAGLPRLKSTPRPSQVDPYLPFIRRIFLQSVDAIRLQVFVLIKKITDTAKTVSAYTARFSTFGLRGKVKPRAFRILFWCSSGRGR
jgi:hypothetical protein